MTPLECELAILALVVTGTPFPRDIIFEIQVRGLECDRQVIILQTFIPQSEKLVEPESKLLDMYITNILQQST
jgi:hypothetical protein